MDQLLPKHPHSALICGKTRSGKTHQMLNILSKFYRDHFKIIYIICPTFKHNETYKKFPIKEYADKIIVCTYPLDKSLNIIIKQQDSKPINALIIIDDCSADKELAKHRTALSHIAFSGRHIKLTTWFVTQRYISTPKDFRDNIDWVLIVKNSCRDSFDKLMRENDVIAPEKHREIKEVLVNNLMLFINVDIGDFLLLRK